MRRILELIKQLPGTECPWHGTTFPIPDNVCPILWHTLYPYFLGAVFGAKYGYNKQGDCQVCCPAEYGVDVLVKVRPYDKRMIEVPKDWRDVIHAEVVKVNGPCDYNHKEGAVVLFPTYAKDKYLCPAGVFNLFPFLKIKVPSCINPYRLRCPDWKENIYYSLEKI